MNQKHCVAGVAAYWVAGVALFAMVCACTPRETVHIGFIGGVSGRVADLGIGGRNGVALAVEWRNKSGGVAGRHIELISEDDEQDPSAARAAVARLIERKVVAIVGPMTSSMAVATVPLVNEAKVIMISPTVTAKALAGLDDFFFRVIDSTTEYARKSAEFHLSVQRSRRVAVAYDLRNQAYTESWLEDYTKTFVAGGGTVIQPVTFSSSDETRFSDVADTLLRQRPDGVLILANSVDTALLAQQIRKRDERVRINTSEWAATERLLELGGRAVEGIMIAQFIDRDSQQPAYLAFRQAYLERFGAEPGFAGLTGFDAANVVLDSLSVQAKGQTLKEAILSREEFSGAQSPIRIDANGDAERETYLTTIRNGAFSRL